jgi:toxin ParE1/3/4
MAAGRRSVRWSPEARIDLSEIWAYYAEVAGRQTADRIVRDIERVCRPLVRHPLAGRARDEVWPQLRSLATGPHVIFYRVIDDGRAEIVRVLDGRRDLGRIFDDEMDAET